MLEIRHVTKIYNAKGGVPTKALNDVSISFGETGLVFLLGKSGSGKSTLLNVSGGLDEPTSGEIIVKGKSSKDFSGSDFDSYRNTFVGFVFQEYNVLDEFNVEDNIALALELQGKPKDRDKINALLQEVDLQNFAKRRPNTLSGGQKQRIAIARALIKDPQIIMADEPTGALDSATGRQVFETLKKLSKTRLVLVVSHDREFAEVYGDRIVELEDGKIISDVTKRRIPAQSVATGVTSAGQNTLTVQGGADLSEDSLQAIRAFICGAEGEVMIARGDNELRAFKKVARITEDGGSESFSGTAEGDVALKSYSSENARFIRSRLPAAKAVRIGASGLKLKPIRLAFTVLLSFIAFVLFGLLSTLMLYNGRAVAASTFAQNGGDYLNIEKNYHFNIVYPDGDVYDSEYNSQTALFTPAELEKFRAEFGNGTFAVYGGMDYSVDNAWLNDGAAREYYYPAIAKFTPVEGGTHTLKLVAGEYPSGADEICISTYLVDVLNNCSFRLINAEGQLVDEEGRPAQSAVEYKITTPQSVVGQYISCGLGCFKVTGVFDSGVIDKKFDDLRSGEFDRITMNMLMYEFQNYLLEGRFKLAIVGDQFYQRHADSFKPYMMVDDEFSMVENELLLFDSQQQAGMVFNSVKAYGADARYPAVFLGEQRQTLADNEIILHADNFINIAVNAWLGQNPMEATPEWQAALKEFTQSLEENIDILSNRAAASAGQVAAAEEWFAQNVSPLCDGDGIAVKITLDQMNLAASQSFKLVGWYVGKEIGIYVSQFFYDSLEKSAVITMQTKYVPPKDATYNGIYIPYNHTEDMIYNLFEVTGYEHADPQTDVFYVLNSALYRSVENANSIVEMLSAVFLWTGVIFAVFASLLMFNFISMSIANKRKEIGILRAVGARGLDVFKIFFAESGIIAGICFVLSAIGTYLLCGLINDILLTQAGLPVTIFVFGWISLAVMAAIAVVIAFISTFLPVYFAARKKPVESIRAL